MVQAVEVKPTQQVQPTKCFECKHWEAMVHEGATPKETYTSIVRQKNAKGKILGVCRIFSEPYAIFDIEECRLTQNYETKKESVH
jgi:hypothetical protein